MLSLWLYKGMFWVPDQRIVDQGNTICRNSQKTELEIEKPERNLAENDSYKEKEISAHNTGNNLEEEVRDVFTALKVDKEISNLKEKEVAIIEEIAEVLERRQKNKLPALRDIPKKKLLGETAKIDKVLCKFKTQHYNELFYVGPVVTNRLEVKINKVAERKEPMWRRRLKS